MIATALTDTAGVSDNAIALLMVATAAVFLFRGRSNIKASSSSSKASGLLMLGIVTVVAIGLAWEISECAAGTHFGDPGDGSNPFDQFCPTDKTSGPQTATP